MSSRVLVATLLDDQTEKASVAFGYHIASRALHKAGTVDFIPGEICYPGDVVRTRSTALAYSLRQSAWDWLLWWDADVVPKDSAILQHMIARAEEGGHDWIGAPYPRKRIPALFPFKMLDEDWDAKRMPVKNDCIEVDLLAIGFTLIRRAALERFVARYREDLWFIDKQGESFYEAVAVFFLMFTETETRHGMRYRELLSEDYSACRRWRAMGGKVQMYVGPGSPVGHVGTHLYTGTKQDLSRVQ